MSDKNMNGKDFLLGAVVGSAVGALAALLLAPKSGRELRGDISTQVGNVSDKTKQLASTVSEKTQSIASDFNVKRIELADKAKELSGKVADDLKQWNDARKQTASSASEASEERVASADVDLDPEKETEQ